MTSSTAGAGNVQDAWSILQCQKVRKLSEKKKAKTTKQKDPKKATVMENVKEIQEPTENSPNGPAKAEMI